MTNDPWCFNCSPGHLIDYPPSGFCTYFNCILTFYGHDDPGNGSIIEAWMAAIRNPAEKLAHVAIMVG